MPARPPEGGRGQSLPASAWLWIKYRTDTIETLRSRGGGADAPHIADFIRGVFRGGAPRMVACRWAQGLLALAADYGVEKVDAACAVTAGYSSDTRRYQAVRRMVSSLTQDDLEGMASGLARGSGADPAPSDPAGGNVYLRALSHDPYDSEQD